MVRRIHLHMDMDESEAAMIRNAARLVKLRPSYYVLNRILRVAEWEIGELTQQNKVQGPPEDIDAGSGVSEGVSGGSSSPAKLARICSFKLSISTGSEIFCLRSRFSSSNRLWYSSQSRAL